MTEPRQTDPDNTRQPESEQDERGLLYISDVQALRRADSICFQVRRDGTAHIDATLTTWAYPAPRIFTATQQRLFPDAHHTDRRRRIQVGVTIVGFDSDRRWHEHALPGACASAMIHAAGLDDVWGSIAGFIRVGDVMTLHWRADNNNQVLIDAGLHRDELRIGIRRGRRSWTFLVAVATGPDDTTRMISRAAQL